MAYTDYFPIGAVLAFGGSSLDKEVWLPCDGEQYDNRLYPDLFAFIGHTYGGAGNTFKVPDYRGVFLRGVSGKSGNDPDAQSRRRVNDQDQRDADKELQVDGEFQVGTVQQPATKIPESHFKGTPTNLPTQTTGALGQTLHNGAYALDNIERKTCTSGGDKETRPVNVYVNYFIKAR